MSVAPIIEPALDPAPQQPRESAERSPARRGTSAGRIWLHGLLVAVAVPVSLAPLTTAISGGWTSMAVAFACALALVAVLARLLGARALSPVLVLVVGVLWITNASAAAEAVLGVVPTRESIAETGRVLVDGFVQVLYAPSTPFESTAEITALALVAVLLLVLLVDAMLALGAPALAAAPLIAPALVPMAFRIELDPVALVPVAAAMVGVLVLGQPGRIRRRAVVAGAVVAMAAVVAPALLPAPSEADIAWPRWLEGPATGPGVAAGPPRLSTGIDLAADLQRGSPVRIFDYAPSDGLPLRMRLTSLQGIGPDGFVEQRGELDTSFDDLGGTGPGSPISTRITLGRAFIGNVPIPVQSTATGDFSGTWRWDPASQSIGFTDPDRIVSLNDQTYSVASVRPAPIPEGESPTSTGEQGALEVPSEAAAFADVAAEVVDEAAPPLVRAQQLFDHFTDDSWAYSEDVPLDGFGTDDGGQWSALESFMDARSGYCVHYASSMAITARAAGIPARVSIGFLPGTDPQADGTYTVTTNDMHAWAELWFDGYGWVPFDTTPAIATGGTVASADDDDDAGATEQPALPSPTAAAPSAAAPAPSDAAASPSASSEPGAAPTPTVGPEALAGPRLDLVVRPLLVALAIVALLLAPAGVREVLRRRRIAEGAGGALWEVQATLADAGRRMPTSSTPGEIAAAVAALTLREPERHALDRLRDAAERERFADEPSTTHAEDARAVIAGIRRTIPRRERLLRTLAPPSLVRVWGRQREPEDVVG
ncbi:MULTISPECIES: transglutaminase family protein [unclassified Agrococcus]|uniref:transglutaminase-like domain-containing protein n=1 Tax=unclassified Agrococcus TaxID=2615065 RepID=UPI00360E8171